MQYAEDTMQLEVNTEHKHFARIMGMKQAISSSILTATARVNSGALRGTTDDDLGAILARVKGATGGPAPIPEPRVGAGIVDVGSVDADDGADLFL